MADSRKVQFLSGRTFSVSLPKRWASGIGLQTGDEVIFEPQPDGKLLLSALGANGHRLVERRAITAQGLTPDQLERRVTALYLEGVEAITLLSERGMDSAQLAAIERLPHQLTGLEIVENTANRIVLQDMLDPAQMDVETAFLRVYGIASAMHRQVLEALSARNTKPLAGLPTQQADLDRLGWIATRHVRLRLRRPDSTQPLPIADHAAIASALLLVQRIGHYALRLAEATTSVIEHPADDSAGPRLLEACSRALLICDIAARAFYKSDLGAADEAFSHITPFEGRITELRKLGIASCADAGSCHPYLGVVQILEWLQASVCAGAGLATLAVQRAVLKD